MLGDIVLIRCHHERVEAIGVDLSMAGPVMASTSPGHGIKLLFKARLDPTFIKSVAKVT